MPSETLSSAKPSTINTTKSDSLAGQSMNIRGKVGALVAAAGVLAAGAEADKALAQGTINFNINNGLANNSPIHGATADPNGGVAGASGLMGMIPLQCGANVSSLSVYSVSVTVAGFSGGTMSPDFSTLSAVFGLYVGGTPSGSESLTRSVVLAPGSYTYQVIPGVQNEFGGPVYSVSASLGGAFSGVSTGGKNAWLGFQFGNVAEETQFAGIIRGVSGPAGYSVGLGGGNANLLNNSLSFAAQGEINVLPEPSTLALIGVGGLLLSGSRRKGKA